MSILTTITKTLKPSVKRLQLARKYLPSKPGLQASTGCEDIARNPFPKPSFRLVALSPSAPAGLQVSGSLALCVFRATLPLLGALACARYRGSLDKSDSIPALKESVGVLLSGHLPPGHLLYLGAQETCQTRLCHLSIANAPFWHRCIRLPSSVPSIP